MEGLRPPRSPSGEWGVKLPPPHTGTGKKEASGDAGESWVDAMVASQLLEGLGWGLSLVWKRGVEGRGEDGGDEGQHWPFAKHLLCVRHWGHWE